MTETATQKIEGSKGQRALTFDLRGVEIGDDRRVEISISSEQPVERWFGTEILDHRAECIDMDFMGGGSAPLLLDHDLRKQIGVVENLRLDTKEKKLRATVRFGKSALAQEILDDVRDGIRSNISVGYFIEKIERNEKTGTVKVIRWRPYETSIVSVPADQTVGVGRAVEAGQPEPKQESVTMTTETQPTPAAPAPAPAETRAAPAAAPNPAAPVQWSESALAQRDAEIRADRDREVKAIYSLAARHNMTDKAHEVVGKGGTLADFRGIVLDNIGNKPLISSDIGMNQREVDRFSVMRLAAAGAPGASRGDIDAARFEIETVEAARQVAEAAGVQVRGSVIPAEVARNWIPRNSSIFARDYAHRVLNVADDSALVPEDYRPGSFIDVLRNSMSVMQAGATVLNGLAGNVDIPKKLTASSATWVGAEHGDSTASEATYGNVTMGPKDISVYTDITRRARQQMNPDIEALTRSDIAAAIGLGLDLAALEGSGTLGQPRGVRNVVGINRPTAFAAANPTYAEVVALETAVADDNALMGNLAYILRTNMAGALKTTEKFAGTGMTVWEPGNTLNGYRAIRSNQGTDGNLYFGNWSDLLVGFWSGLDLQFDYAALALKGGLRIIAFQTCDIAVRHAQSFAWNRNGV